MTTITRFRTEEANESKMVAHVAYVYEGDASGTDQRIFIFEKSEDGNWLITSMGDRDSARFDSNSES